MKKKYFLLIGLFIVNIANAQWHKKIGFEAKDIRCFAEDNGNMLIGTNKGIYQSKDSGTTWMAVNNGLLSADIRDIYVNEAGIFAGDFGGGVYFSSDHANSWVLANNGLTNHTVQTIVGEGTTILAGTLNGVFLSVNNGISWASVNNGITDTNIKAIAIIGNNFFVGTESGVFLSTNNGINWSAVNTGLINTNINTLCVRGDTVYAGTNGGGIFYTVNNGLDWNEANVGLIYKYVYTLETNDTTIYAGTSNGVFSSTDFGANWVFRISFSNIESLFVKENFLFIGTSEGVYSFNCNTSFLNFTSTGLINDCTYSMAVDGNKIYAGTNQGGLYFSYDCGITWQISCVTPIMGNTMANNILSIAIKDTNIFIGTYDDGIFRSTNMSATWSNVNSDLNRVESIVIKGSDIFAASSNNIFLSPDYGAQWLNVSNGLPPTSMQSLAVSDNNIFAGTYTDGVYLSSDNGTNWVAVNNGLPYGAEVTTIIKSDSIVLAGTYGDGIFRTFNNGTNWQEINTGLTNKHIYSMAAKGRYIFAGTGNGLFLSDDYGNSWTLLNTGTAFYAYFINALAICGSSIFVGTCQNGIWEGSFPEMLNSEELDYNYSISIYPNPTKDYIIVEIPQNTIENMLTICNLNGQELMRQQIIDCKTQIDVHNLTNGMYYVKLTSDKTVNVRKIVKE